MSTNTETQDREGVELRLTVPRRLANLLDAYSIANGQNRTQYALKVLAEWERLRLHEMNMAARITRRNPRDAGADGSDSGFGALGAE